MCKNRIVSANQGLVFYSKFEPRFGSQLKFRNVDAIIPWSRACVERFHSVVIARSFCWRNVVANKPAICWFLLIFVDGDEQNIMASTLWVMDCTFAENGQISYARKRSKNVSGLRLFLGGWLWCCLFQWVKVPYIVFGVVINYGFSACCCLIKLNVVFILTLREILYVLEHFFRYFIIHNCFSTWAYQEIAVPRRFSIPVRYIHKA